MASLSDYILGLQKQEAANNTYSQIGSAILNSNVSQPVTAGSAGTNFATNLLKGLLGGGLAAYGNVENQRYTEGIQDVLLPRLRGEATVANENLSESDVSRLSRSADIFKAAQAEDRASLFADLKMKAVGAGMSKEAEMTGEFNARKSIFGGDLLSDPESPQYKVNLAKQAEEDAARKEISALPAVQKYNTTSTALSQLKNIKDLDTASSDIPFATLLIGGLDGSVVREGEYSRVAGSNPFLAKYQNLLEGALNGTSTLGVEIKKQMFNELTQTQMGLLDEANRSSAPRIATALSRGAETSKAMPFDPRGILPDDNETAAIPAERPKTTESVPPGMKLQRNPSTGETRLVPQ